MKKLMTIILLAFGGYIFAQSAGDVIINEIANGVNKKALYNGGDYVELLVMKDDGIKLGGWYLTDLSSTGGTLKETQGWIKFSDAENSVFSKVIPKGTYILVCLGTSEQNYGKTVQTEDVSIDDGNNRIVVFQEGSKDHIIVSDSGRIGLTAKDNIALVSSWNKKAGIDCVSWGREISWQGCDVTNLSQDMLENGKLVYLKTETVKHTDPALWVSTSDKNKCTPGAKNPAE